MILIGMFDSPYVRRVAIAMTLHGIAFDHRNWSVGKDAERIREYNPQARVPTLVLDSGEVLVESALILEYVEELAQARQDGAVRTPLLPPSGVDRRQVLRLIGLATGAVDKGILIVMERIFRPPAMRHEPWLERCRGQVAGVLTALDAACTARPDSWLVGDRMSLADITVGAYCTYLQDAVPHDLAATPALQAYVERCEALPVFRQFYVPFDAPTPTGLAAST